MRVSLRTKTILLMLVTLACTVCPLMYMSLHYSKENLMEEYKADMKDLLNLAEYTIKANFSEILHIKALAITGERNVMTSNTHIAVSLLHQLRSTGESREHCAALLRSLSTGGQMEVLHKNGTTWDGQSVGLYAELAKNPETINTISKTIAHLTENETEEFISFPETASSILVCIVPIPHENSAIVVLSSLTPAIQHTETTLATLRANTAAMLNSLQTLGDDGGVFTLHTNPLRFNDSRKIPFSPEVLPLLDDAIRTGQTALTIPSEKGALLCMLKFMPRHQIVLLAAVSETELTADLNSLILQQRLYFAGLLLVGTVLAVLFSGHLISPLAHFSSMAQRLPHHDFSLGVPSETTTLPVTRNDEIGDLARGFAQMENLLHGAVHRLVQTVTAKERLERELQLAREIQEGILPKTFPVFPDHPEIRLFPHLVPAREIGGDLYDFFFVDDSTLCVAIGDVSGKGIAAALFMSITVTLLRTAMQPGVRPEQVLEKLNNDLALNNPQDMFVSLFLGLYNVHSGELCYAVGGHPLPIRVTPHLCEPLPCAEPDMTLGLFPNISYSGLVTRLEPGETLFLYTDGVTEATTGGMNFYGESRLVRCLASCAARSEPEIIRAVTEDLAAFVGEASQADDITMLLLRYNAAASGETS